MIRLIVGGARSGKSSYAESLYHDMEDVVYIGTSIVDDKEMEERVKHHRETRPSEWRTYEGNYNLIEAIGKERKYLLDCLTVLTSNIMFDITKDVEYIDHKLQKVVEDRIIDELQLLINEIRNRNFNLIMVTNEVGYSLVPEHHISRVFRDIQGRINQRIATLCDEVYLVSCGIPVKLK